MQHSSPSNTFHDAASAAIDQAERAQENRSVAMSYARTIAKRVLTPLKKLGLIQGPTTGGGPLPIDDLVGEMAILEYDDGFTFSPILGPGNKFLVPAKGHCVALPGSNVSIAFAGAVTTIPLQELSTEPRYEPEDVDIARLAEWAQLMARIFDSGHAWIGGYRQQDGTFDTEATVVFEYSYRAEAEKAANKWKQESYWSIQPGGGGSLKRLNNSPPGSVFEALMQFSR